MEAAVTFLSLTLFSGVIFVYIQNIQPNPYMDEIFHVPQAQKYCDGNFTVWDPMITTLPGLYLASVGLLKPMSSMVGLDIHLLCTTFWLRAVNVLFMIGNFYVMLCIYRILHPEAEKENKRKLATMVMTLTLFPLLYFFTFLYYTDPGSVFFVLMTYLFHLQGNRFLAAVMSVASIFFRQTNIIWVLFVAGLSAQEQIMSWMKHEKKDLYISKIQSFDTYLLETFFNLVFTSLRNKPISVFKLIFNILISAFWYICVIIGFMAFVYYNDGIVVGDRSHHQACFNVPQLFYFFSFTFVLSSPYMISIFKLFDFREFVPKNFFVSSLLCFLSTVAVYELTYVHQYLLADNRHYTFYVWSKIYNRFPAIRYVLVPFYYFAAFQFFRLLKHRDIFWKVVFMICLVAATVPQKLMEFRYFIIPYLIFRLNMKLESWFKLICELSLYTIINVVTLYLFCERPFLWPDSQELHRFMW